MNSVTDYQVVRIPGWFERIDIAAFRVLLEATSRRFPHGDLAELGVYQGKSAVLIGSYRRPDETFTVIDLFGDDPGDAANTSENQQQYADLTRGEFEAAYREVHGNLPVVVQGFSSDIVRHAAPGTHRFVHIDASHLYEFVVDDLVAAKTLLQPDGVVVLDDFRTEHTPGVAAAAWQEVGRGLRPFLLTPAKMYATWGDSAVWLAAVDSWLAEGRDLYERQSICGHEVVRVWSNTPKVARYLPPVVIPALRRLRARSSRGVPAAAEASPGR